METKFRIKIIKQFCTGTLVYYSTNFFYSKANHENSVTYEFLNIYILRIFFYTLLWKINFHFKNSKIYMAFMQKINGTQIVLVYA